MNYLQAQDEILARVKLKLDALSVTTVWVDTAAITEVPIAPIWVRVMTQMLGRAQAGFGDTTRKYTSQGILSIEVYATGGDGKTAAWTLANDVVTHLENTRNSQVWYRNIRATDMAKDGSYARVNVLADFNFDDHH